MDVNTWAAAPGRLGEGGDPLPANAVCWRCGAVPATSSPCTEKRGAGPPWQHEFLDRESARPWGDYRLDELYMLTAYLEGKARSSLYTALSFKALVARGRELGFSRTQRYQHKFAQALYAEKATKRLRLLTWSIEEYERRVKEGG
jgi:hypothetical protein